MRPHATSAQTQSCLAVWDSWQTQRRRACSLTLCHRQIRPRGCKSFLIRLWLISAFLPFQVEVERVLLLCRCFILWHKGCSAIALAHTPPCCHRSTRSPFFSLCLTRVRSLQAFDWDCCSGQYICIGEVGAALGFRWLVPRGDGLRLLTKTAWGSTLRNNHHWAMIFLKAVLRQAFMFFPTSASCD